MNLVEAMNEINNANETKGVPQRGGKKYTEVFVRVEIFRKTFGTDLGIKTEIILNDGKFVIVKATIEDKDGHVVGSGLAEEVRGSSNVNKTSALENCETSAIGRALASLGLHGGTYASLNEIDAVKRKEIALQEKEQTELKEQQKLIDWETRVLTEFSKITNDKQFSERDRMSNLKQFKTELSNLHTMPGAIQKTVNKKYNEALAYLGAQMGKNNGNVGSNTETS
tara:strand:- start:332 stop:1006 length:675 start_codon:yes stop_codon:yes gene_type:complete